MESVGPSGAGWPGSTVALRCQPGRAHGFMVKSPHWRSCSGARGQPGGLEGGRASQGSLGKVVWPRAQEHRAVGLMPALRFLLCFGTVAGLAEHR